MLRESGPFILCFVLCAAGCVNPDAVRRSTGSRAVPGPEHLVRLEQAEDEASEEGRRVLRMGRQMTITNREIIPGACWDYANAVYNRAGYPEEKRRTIFKGGKKGPYADAKLFRGGDWLYLVNHSYGGIEHSAIFVRWIDRGTGNALMLSYAGENRRTPARYVPYDLSRVYTIIRPTSGTVR